MNRTMICGAALLATAYSASAAEAPKKNAKAAKSRPNIILMIADDCRMRDLGCYGSPCSKTPNIDRLCSEGLKFERFFQATSVSSPTRHCLLTGWYPVHSGAYPNHTFIQPEVQTLPYYMKEAGYRVATQAKRHYAPKSQFPFEYLDGDRETTVLKPALVDRFLAEASESDQPFFLYLATGDPHSPWTRGDQSQFNPETIILPCNLVDTPETRRQYCNYLAEVNQVDRDLGAIEESLEKYGLRDNTIFIFTSEQGYSFPFAKWTCYDEGLQTGFLVRWPGVIRPGSVTDVMCEYVDVTPTLVDIAGGKVQDEVDGQSFKNLLLGKKYRGKDYVYAQHTARGIIRGPEHYGTRSCRSKEFLYIRNLTPEAHFSCHTFGEDYFLSWQKAGQEGDEFAARQALRYEVRPGEELYDVVADPFQQHNIADDPAYAAVKADLSAHLDAWMERCGDKGQETEMEAFLHQASKMHIK